MLEKSKTFNFQSRKALVTRIIKQQKQALRLIDLNKQQQHDEAIQHKPSKNSIDRIKSTWSLKKKYLSKLVAKQTQKTLKIQSLATVNEPIHKKANQHKKQSSNNINWKQSSCLQLLNQLQKNQTFHFKQDNHFYQISKQNLIDFLNAFRIQYSDIHKRYVEACQNYDNLKKYLLMTCPNAQKNCLVNKESQNQLTLKNKLQYYQQINSNLLLSLKHLTKMQNHQFLEFKNKLMKFRPNVEKELMRQLAEVTQQKNNYKKYLNFLTKDIHKSVLCKIDWSNASQSNDRIQKQIEQIVMSINNQITKELQTQKNKIDRERIYTLELNATDKQISSYNSILKSQQTIRQVKKSTFQLNQQSSEQDYSQQQFPSTIEQLQSKFDDILNKFPHNYTLKLNFLRRIYTQTIQLLNSKQNKEKIYIQHDNNSQYLARFYQLLDRFEMVNNKLFFLCEKYEQLITTLNLPDQNDLLQQLRALKHYCRENMVKI